LKDAGIQVWMLTGDRVETGVSIAISSGLKNKSDELFFITDGGQPNEIARKLVEYKKKATSTILIIDGKTLDLVLESE
jgi:phospholipid-translocating ATPase